MAHDLDRPVNRLAGETSPYLLQHQHNPVDWYPWGPEAIARARAEEKPIFLSVGYSACNWCHVMEHESFEDPDIAALMNEHFVNVKVDREERHDLDQIYMAAVHAMTDHGGGFARYSTDERWLVPHFEKMLYDNALLASVYLEAYQVTRNPDFARVVRETMGWVRSRMTGPEGEIFSTEDADSEGEEGKY